MTPAEQKALHEEVVAHMGVAGDPVTSANLRLSNSILALGNCLRTHQGWRETMRLFAEVEAAELGLRRAIVVNRRA